MLVVSEKEFIDRIPTGVAIFEWDGARLQMRFLNQGYCTMMGYAPGSYTPLVGEEAGTRIHPDDRAHLLSAVRLAQQRGGVFSEIVRIYSQALGRYKSVCVRASLARQEENCCLFYASLDDVDGMVHAQEKLTEEQTALGMAINTAGILYFEYNPADHVARLAAGTCPAGVPPVLADFPECLFPRTVPDAAQAEILRSAFRRMDEGGERESFVLCAHFNGHTRWYNCHLNSVYGLDGVRRKVACTAFDITHQREAALAYQRHTEAVMRMNPNAISTFRLNLTRNTCEFGSSNYPNFLALKAQGTADGYMADSVRFITAEKDKKKYAALFQRENLLAMFEKGHTNFALTHTYQVYQGGTRLLTTKVDMMQSPLTGDVEAILCAVDDTQRYLTDALEAQLLGKEFEKILLVDAERDRFVRYHTAAQNVEERFGNAWNYEAERRKYAETNVHTSEKTKFLEKTELSYVRRQLVDNERFFFTVYGKGKDNRRLHKITYHYLNKDKAILLVTIEDLTRVMDWDVLTGAFNRSGFAGFVEPILKKRNAHDRYAILYFNTRGFKAINELFGTEGGDCILRETLDILRNSALRPLAIARLEADHFVCLIRQENLDCAEITRICNRFYKRNGKQMKFYSHCGIYMVGEQQHTVTGMCDRAKLAKDYIADDYVKPYAVYNSPMRENFMERRQLCGELEHALSNREFLVYYQPIYDTKTHRVVSAEALVRWQHPTRGILSPGLFVPALEENGYISKLDLYVARTVRQMLTERNARQQFVVPVAVNLSRMDFYDSQLMSTLLNELTHSALPADSLRFEVTESAYAAVAEDAVELINTLKEHDARILIDDFGSGYSSFSAIRDFRFDYLKLDMGFVRNIGQNQKNEWIIRAIIEMAHNMGAQVIAEGVETEAQLEFLAAQSCDYIQGYYFSRPLPEQEFNDLLNREQARRAAETEATHA